jgi:RNase adapter protein RapZ
MTADHRPAGEPAAPAPAGPDDARNQQVVVLTGLSGGGKTAAAKLFEDLGYIVVDNLPGELLRDLADLIAQNPTRFAHTAIVLDARTGDVPLAFGAMRGALEGRGLRPVIFFLEASDDVLIRRFSETRHRHPLADERGIATSIELERALLESIRMQADAVIDTSHLSLRELRERIFARLGDVQNSEQLTIQLISFGFKFGVPLEADLVLDVRFMQNPHYIESLRHQSGLTDAVREYVMAQPIAELFLGRLEGLLDLLVPAYVDEGKTRLTIAIGCTGGFHRSIVMTEELAAWLREREFGPVSVFHRELER